MSFTLEETAQLRDELYHLNPDQSAQDRLRYETLRAFYIGKAEGSVAQAYKDVIGIVTVGIGFNMERKESRMEWLLAFGSEGVDFDAVYQGAMSLSPVEIDTLFKSGLALREKELTDSYREIWPQLRPNERLATESAYYNGACLVQGPYRDEMYKVIRNNGIPEGATRYYTHLEHYVLKRDVDALKQAVIELRDYSNRRNIYGLAVRRASEAELLSSFKVSGFLVAA